MSGTTSDPQVKPAPKPHPPKPSTTTANWRTALLIAAALAALLIALNIASVIIALVNDSFYRITSSGGGFNLSVMSDYLTGFVREVFSYLLPLAAGVFVSLKFIAPITSTTSVATVLLRGLIATAVGVAMATVFVIVGGFIGGLSFAGPLFGGSFPQVLGVDNVGFDFLYRISTMLPSALQIAPTVVLIVILGWLWMRRVPLKTAS